MSKIARTGDIVLFKAAKNNWLEQCIAKLTNSEISHAAMVYSNDSLIQMTAEGIGIYGMEEMDGDSVYIMRLDSEPDSASLVKTAETYLNADIRYDFPALVILAGLLIYRHTAPRAGLFDITNKIVTAACVELDRFLQKMSKQGSSPALICSQLVYQIYHDSGEDYKIRLKEDNMVSANYALKDASSYKQPVLENITADPETLGRELMEVLATPVIRPTIQTPIHNSVLHKRLWEIIERSNVDITPESLFVMPGDMLSHSVNLKNVGKCNLIFKS